MMKTCLFFKQMLALLLFVCSSVLWGQTAIYTVSTTNSVTSSGTAPAGSSATYSQTYTAAAKQLTSGNSATLTLSGYSGYKITSIVLNMKSNASAGAGTLAVTAGTTSIASVSPAAGFNSTSWYGSWSTSYVDVTKTPSSYFIQNGEQVKIVIAATVNSLFINSYSITYVASPTQVPTVTASSQNGTVGSAFSYQLQATQSPDSYALTTGSTLPSGLVLNSTTGLISGTPITAGTFSVGVTATNGLGTSTPSTIDFSIAKQNQTLNSFSDTSIAYPTNNTVTLPLNTDQGLPVTYTSSDTSIATVSGNIVTFLQAGTVNITASQSGDSNNNPFSVTKIFKAVNTCFSEDFSSITTGNSTSTGGSGTSWTGNTNFPTVSTAYQAGGAIRLGSGSSNGSVTSKQLNDIGGDVSVIFDVKGWSAVEGTISVTLGGQSQTVNYTAVMGGSFETKSLNFSNVPVGSTLTISTAPSNGARAFIDNVMVSCGTATIWNGTAWSNGIPDNTKITGINGDYSGPAFTSNNLTINSGKTLDVQSSVTAANVVNNGNIIVRNNSNFIQTAGSIYTAGTGSTFKVQQNTISAANKYAFWSSPVASQNMHAIFPGNTPQYVMTYNTTSDYYDVVASPSTSTAGVGYSIKTPAASPDVEFAGTPNNGSVSPTLSTAGGTYNLVGNPYPSNLNLTALYNANTSNIGSTLWFWDNASNSITLQSGTTTTNLGYATYNAASSTWTAAPNIATAPTGTSARIGQGFIVEATGTSLNFTNDMRVATAPASFNKNSNSNAEGKYWIRLLSSNGRINTQAITYGQGATNAFDAYDSKAMGMGSDAFYSIAGTENLIIQGRAPFNIDDVVPLGNQHVENGSFTIELAQKEGLFNNAQPIYLHDKQTGAYTDLQTGVYTFTSNAGNFTNRFEIVYKLSALGTGETTLAEITVAKDGDEFVVNAPEKIGIVTLYDAAGRVVSVLKGSGTTMRVKPSAKGIYFINVETAKQKVSKKIIK